MMAQLRRLSQDEAYQHQQQQHQQQQQHYYYPPMPYMNMPPHPHWQLPPNLPAFAPPPHHYPESPPSASSSSSVEDYAEHASSPRRVWRSHYDRTTPKVHFHPYPHRRRYNSMEMPTERVNGLPRRHSDNFMNGRMILPRLATFLVNNPDQSPESYLTHISDPSLAAATEESAAAPAPVTRRLSVQDLCNPIESLHEQEKQHQQQQQHQHQQEQQEHEQQHQAALPDNNSESISLTEAEYEALQGFGRFRLVMSSSSSSITNEDESL